MFEHSSCAATVYLASATTEGDFVLMVDYELPLSGTRQCSTFEQYCSEQEGRAARVCKVLGFHR